MKKTAANKTQRQSIDVNAVSKRKQLGQVFTPAPTAQFMASLLSSATSNCHLLDTGAGLGALSGAFLEECVSKKLKFDSIQLRAFDLDDELHPHLHRLLDGYIGKVPLTFDITGGDFIAWAVNRIQADQCNFTHAILNPPYQKVGSQSPTRQRLRQVGIETVNRYSAFVALSILLMEEGGQIVAIIPRSFCNGPYYRPFRKFILEHAAIRHLHLFELRDKIFKAERVLQETIVIHLERGVRQGDVTVSTSSDDHFSDFTSRGHSFNQIVRPDDPEGFIRIPTRLNHFSAEQHPDLNCSLADIGAQVSTGQIMDYRFREQLCNTFETDSVPLLYPCHCRNGSIKWPNQETKRANSIKHNCVTEKSLYPKGWYCVVRRISSKDEKRRIVASVVDPDIFHDFSLLGFENHLNVFHDNKQGMPKHLARGLAMFLNSAVADNQFRQFSGHTQVNATDLKQMRYPNRSDLIKLSRKTLQAINNHQGEVSMGAHLTATEKVQCLHAYAIQFQNALHCYKPQQINEGAYRHPL
jgi:adenine-specific DNA-methyltransferase